MDIRELGDVILDELVSLNGHPERQRELISRLVLESIVVSRIDDKDDYNVRYEQIHAMLRKEYGYFTPRKRKGGLRAPRISEKNRYGRTYVEDRVE